MEYWTVKEIESFYSIEHVLKLSRSLWYKLAEGYEQIPTTYLEFTQFISNYEQSYFSGWKLCVETDGTLSLLRTINSFRLFIQIDRSGKDVFSILLCA